MKLSFPLVIKLFYFSLLIVILILISLTSIESLESQYENANLKARQLNKNEISKLHEILNQRYDRLLKLLEKEVDLSDDEIKKLQKQNVERNRQLNQKYLHHSEYLAWQSHNLNSYDSPLLLLSFQPSQKSYLENLENLTMWSRGLDPHGTSRINFPISSLSYPKIKQISDLKLKFIGDINRRTISLSNDDIVKFTKINDELDGELSKKLVEFRPIRILLDQFTWSTPNSTKELQQAWPLSVYSTHVGTATIKELIPMLTVAGYLYSQNSLFGQIPHHYIDMATQVFKDELNRSGSILKTNLNQWDFLSHASFGENQSLTKPVLPKNVTLLKVDKTWLMRSIAAQTIEELRLKNILIEFKEYKLSNNYLKLNDKDKASFINKVESIKSFEGMTRKNWKLTASQEWANSTHIFTSKVLQLGAPVRIYRWQSKTEIRKAINRSISKLLLALLSIITFLVLITQKDLKIVRRGIKNCMDLIMARDIPNLEGRNELNILARAIQLFNQRILWRKQSTKLKRRILQITNIPRLKPNQYLEEFRYACKDISERFKFKISSEPNCSDTCVSISVGLNWQKSLEIDSDTIQFLFHGPLEEHEIDHLRHDLQVLVDRSEIQSQLIRSDKLGADLELSKALQKVLDPIHHSGLEPPQICEAIPLLVRSNYMLFDAMDRADAGQRINLYHIDMSTRGLSSALLASSFKSSLHSLLQLSLTPSQCLQEFNEMIIDQNIEDLLVSCAILQIDQSNNNLIFSSAGHSGLYSIENHKYVSLHRSNIPLGITTNYNFKEYTQKIRSGDYCFFSNGVHSSKSLPDPSYFDESRSLKKVTAEITQNLDIQDLKDDYCAWFVRIP